MIGCGIVGLTTARLLQEKGRQVNIYAKELSPKITSSLATGTWSPSHLICEKDKITPQFQKTWEQACAFSFQTYQNLLGFGDIVTWIDSYALLNKMPEASKLPGSLHLPGLLPESRLLSKRQHPFKASVVATQPTMVFNIPSYLHKLTNDFQSFGGKIHIREIKNLQELNALPERCIVNCTGLGAKALFNDDELIPISGQLSFLIPQPEINYMLETPYGYVLPRKDGLVLGGNAKRGNWDTTPDPKQTETVINAINNAMLQMRG